MSTYTKYLYIFRILERHMPEYKDQGDMVNWHIPSQHSTEMSTQSNVVCLLLEIL